MLIYPFPELLLDEHEAPAGTRLEPPPPPPPPREPEEKQSLPPPPPP